MSKFENILFDFDGTLFDTSKGVLKSFDNVIGFYNLQVKKSDYRKMMGPPLEESFLSILKLPKSEIENAIQKYREYYSEHGIFELDEYEGVEKLLLDLRATGKKLFVATSKPEFFAKKILSKFEMLHFFEFVGGADLHERKRVKKTDVIKYVLENNELKPENCLMVGDREYDIKGANHFGIASCGILWGFGLKDELLKAGADFICKTPTEVFNLVCS